MSADLPLCDSTVAAEEEERRGGDDLMRLPVGPSWRPLLLASATACLAKLDAVCCLKWEIESPFNTARGCRSVQEDA